MCNVLNNLCINIVTEVSKQDMTEKLIIEQIKKKERKAQEKFYLKYATQMFRLVYIYVYNNQDAESIVNQGFFKVFNNIHAFIYQGETKLTAWIKKIMINEALIFLRKKIKFTELTDNLSIKTQTYIKTDHNLILEDYSNLLRKLPQKLRTVFNLYAIEGFSHKEIAQMLNIREVSSRVYLLRARELLQKYILDIE